MKKKILLIEDNQEIAEMVQAYLTENSYEVTVAGDGESGILLFHQGDPYDLVLLDIMLPKKNGLEVMAQIRAKSLLPIIIISARNLDMDKTAALDLGADDYLTKPFSLAELGSRIKAVLRRVNTWETQPEQNKALLFSDLVLDLDNYTLLRGGVPVTLTATEFEILKLFLQNPQRTFTKVQIYAAVWQEDYLGDENVVNVHISRLREKLGDNGKNSKYIETLWGIGYRLRKEANEKV